MPKFYCEDTAIPIAEELKMLLSVGNSMICSDIWHKYHECYFEIVLRNLRQFWNITSGIYAKYNVQIMLLFVYTTTLKRFVIFSCSSINERSLCFVFNEKKTLRNLNYSPK